MLHKKLVSVRPCASPLILTMENKIHKANVWISFSIFAIIFVGWIGISVFDVLSSISTSVGVALGMALADVLLIYYLIYVPCKIMWVYLKK